MMRKVRTLLGTMTAVVLVAAVPAAHAQSSVATTQIGNNIVYGERVLSDFPDDTGKAAYVFHHVRYTDPMSSDYRWKKAPPYNTSTPPQIGVDTAGKAADRIFCAQPGRSVTEDCLVVTVNVPETGGTFNPSASLPVMVWIHGGSLLFGSGDAATYDATNLAAHGGVIVVTINYRLGVFGYLASPELSTEGGQLTGFAKSGNYGLLDQIDALRWVQSYIGAFGGDKNNVTVFGESAGGQSVNALMASANANGLFRRAILESGHMASTPILHTPTTAGDPKAIDGYDTAETIGSDFEKRLLGSDPVTVKAMRDKSVGQVLGAAYTACDYQFRPKLTAGGWALPDQVVNLLEAKANTDTVPVMIGFNAGEMYPLGFIPSILQQSDYAKLFPENAATGVQQYTLDASDPQKYPTHKDGYPARIRQGFGKDWGNLYLGYYPDVPDTLAASAPATLLKGVEAGVRDGLFGWASTHIAEIVAGKNQASYVYFFDHSDDNSHNYAPGSDRSFKVDWHGSHGAEVDYVFGHIVDTGVGKPSQACNGSVGYPPPSPNASDENRALSRVIMDSWTSFAKGQVPNFAPYDGSGTTPYAWNAWRTNASDPWSKRNVMWFPDKYLFPDGDPRQSVLAINANFKQADRYSFINDVIGADRQAGNPWDAATAGVNRTTPVPGTPPAAP